MIEIRKARLSDIDDVQAVGRNTILSCFPSVLGEEQVRNFVECGLSGKEITDHADNLHVLLKDGRIVGFSTLLDDLIHLMMVDVRLHRRGYGSRLLAWCEDHMLSAGYSIARLETFIENEQVIRFDRKNGWRSSVL